jgi:SMP-30/Gluconolactonase/LRE-like region
MDGSSLFTMILRRYDHRLRSHSSSLLIMNLIIVLVMSTLYAAVNTPLALAEGNEVKPVIHPLPYLNTTLRTSSPNIMAAKREGAPAAPKGPICKREEHEKCVEFYATPLHFYGGEVQVEPTVFLIFWGSNFQKGTLETQLRELYNSFMTLPGGNLAYQGILTQYHGHDHLSENKEADIGSTILFGGRWDDNRESAPKSVTRQAVEEEVHQAIQVNSWPQNNPNAQFIVFIPSGSTISSALQKEGECGFHTVTTEGNLVYAFVPYQGLPEFGGACLASVGEENGNHSTMATASHEYAEAATDPHPTEHVVETHGWTNTENKEIADICDRGAIELKTGAGIWVQELWGNNEKGCVLADPPEPLPPAPSVTTGSATGVTACAATLNGTVNPHESESHYHFQYGVTTSYGSSTPEGNAGFGEVSVPVNTHVTGLASGATYHYRLVASSFVGTGLGEDRTFTTPFTPPVYSSQFGTVGAGEGQFNSASFDAVDANGNVWVTDSGNNRVEEFTGSGKFIRIVGSKGIGGGQFIYPTGIAVNRATGDIYVADYSNNRIEEFSTTDGKFIREFGTFGHGNGQLLLPDGLALDASGNVWVVDSGNYRVERFSSTGTFISTFGSMGTGNGQFSSPVAIAIDSSSNVYVTDNESNLNEVNRVEEFSSQGSYLRQFGSKGSGNGQFDGPHAITSDPITENIFVSDEKNNRVEVFTPTGTFLGKFGVLGSGQGQFSLTRGITIDSTGDVYVIDAGNNRVEKWIPPC